MKATPLKLNPPFPWSWENFGLFFFFVFYFQSRLRTSISLGARKIRQGNKSTKINNFEWGKSPDLIFLAFLDFLFFVAFEGIPCFFLSVCVFFSAFQEKGTPTQTFGSGYPPVGWGFSTWRGGGRRVRCVPRNQGNQTFFGGISRDFAGISRGRPKSLKKRFVFNSRPLEYGFMYGSKRWKSQFAVDSQLRTQLAKQLRWSSSKIQGGNFFVQVRFRGVPGTVEEVVRVRCCCLLCWKTNTENTSQTVLGHRPNLAWKIQAWPSDRQSPHVHKSKIGTSTPPPFQRTHDPPPKTRNVMGMGVFSCTKTQKFQAPTKLMQPFPDPG